MGNEQFLKDVGRRISARRKELHMTQETVAEKMEVSVQMISNVELGKKAIRPENLVKLCTVLDTSADYILRGLHSESELLKFVKTYSRLSTDDQDLVETLANRLLK